MKKILLFLSKILLLLILGFISYCSYSPAIFTDWILFPLLNWGITLMDTINNLPNSIISYLIPNSFCYNGCDGNPARFLWYILTISVGIWIIYDFGFRIIRVKNK